MTIAIFDDNECNFAVKFDDESAKEKVVKYMIAGLRAWYAAAHDNLDEDDLEYFSQEDIEGFYDAGYAEPTCELLDRDGIKHEIIDIEYDIHNQLITQIDEEIWY